MKNNKRKFQGNQYVGTKWQQFGTKIKNFFTTISLYALILSIALLALQAGRTFYPITIEKVLAKEVFVDNLTGKVEQLKNEYVDGIRNCERAGHSEDDGIIVFDSNNKASIGEYQFQKKTVVYYYKKLYAKDITAKEAVMIALDSDKARKLAYDVIFTVKDGEDNWYNCSRKPGMEQKLAIIKELQN